MTILLPDKIGEALEDVNDESSDEAVDPPNVTDYSLEISFADKQELAKKITLLDNEQLPTIVEIIQKFEEAQTTGSEMDIDMDILSNKTLRALQEFIHSGIVPGMNVKITESVWY